MTFTEDYLRQDAQNARDEERRNERERCAPLPRVCVVVCAWCADKDAKTAAATAAGFDVTHGLCLECAAIMRRAILRQDECHNQST
jgi:hypothetical protein